MFEINKKTNTCIFVTYFKNFYLRYRTCVKFFYTHVHVCELSGEARDKTFSLKLYLHPFFMWVSNEGSCETGTLHRRVSALGVCICNKYTS